MSLRVRSFLSLLQDAKQVARFPSGTGDDKTRRKDPPILESAPEKASQSLQWTHPPVSIAGAVSRPLYLALNPE